MCWSRSVFPDPERDRISDTADRKQRLYDRKRTGKGKSAGTCELGRGWSDTPPYCNEHGGTVLNAAILLRGCEPIEVEIRKIPELHIELASTDTGAYGTAESAEEIQDCHNPYDPFALHKAAIIACGILPLEERPT